MTRALAIAMFAGLASSAFAQSYLLVDLGTLGGQSEAFAVDSLRHAVGSSTLPTAYFSGADYGAVGTNAAATPVNNPAGRTESVAFCIDELGNTYGTTYDLGGFNPTGFKTDSGGNVTPLGPVIPRHINAAGTLAGTTDVTTNGYILQRAVSVTGTTITQLSTLGGLIGNGMAVNGTGRVVGNSTTANEAATRPCIWVGSTPLDLGTLGGNNGQATDINAGIIVGASQTAQGLWHATKWWVNAAGAVQQRADLGALPTTASSFAKGMNSSGTAVGTSNFHACLFTGTQVIDLNSNIHPDPQWVLEVAWAINDRNVIVGRGSKLGFPRAFMLVPCSSDFNGDGDVGTDADIEAFFACLAGNCCPTCWSADFNWDGDVGTDADIEAFFRVLAGGNC